MRKKIDHVNQSSQPVGEAADAAAPEGRDDAAAAPPRDDDVLEAIHAVMHLARSQQHRALRDAEQTLSPMEGRVLGFFARHPGATLSELVAHSGRDKGQLARLVAGLRARGLLQAAPDEVDRRVSRLHLAGQALAQHAALTAQRCALSERAAAGLTPAERRQLLALLAKVRTALQPTGGGSDHYT